MRIALPLVLLLLLAGCKARTPRDVVSAGKMERLLYDYHLAQALAQQEAADSADYFKALYTDAALRKHKVSREEFDRSMAYYNRHSDQLHAIYQRLDQRYAKSTALTQGAPIASVSQNTDTVLVWEGAEQILLCSNGQNRLEFTLQPDTSFHADDRLLLLFGTQWLYHEGSKQGVAVITLRYAGDSVVTSTRQLYDSGQQEMLIFPGKERLTGFDCFIYQNAPWSERPRYLIIRQPRLFRIRHKSAAAPGVTAKPDSVATADTTANPRTIEQLLRDSLLDAEHADKQRSHFQ